MQVPYTDFVRCPDLSCRPMHSPDTEELILDAALEEFSEQGYANAGFKGVAARANLTMATLFAKFPSKERMFLSLMDRFANSVERKVHAAIGEHLDATVRIAAATEACLDGFGQYRRELKILMVHTRSLGPAFDQKVRDIQTRFAAIIQDLLDDAIRQRQIDPVDTEVVAAAWTGSIYHLVMQWSLTGYPEQDRMLATLIPLLMRSVGLPNPAVAKSSTRS